MCLFALLFAAAVWAAVLLCPPKERVDSRADGRIVTVVGTVEWKEYVRTSSNTLSLQVTLRNIGIESGIPSQIEPDVLRGDKILCVLGDDPALQENYAKEGTTVRVRGKARLYRKPSNDGEFDAFLYYTQIRGYLFSVRDARILSYTQTKDPLMARLYEARKNLSASLDLIYKEKDAQTMKAMLFGQTGLMEEQNKEQYQSSGILHILCISGVHLSLIGSGLFLLFKKAGLPLPFSCAVSVILLILYGFLTGLHTSCFRALIMFGFRAAAKAMGRTYDSMTALAVAAVLLLLEQPAYLYHSGFLFSFAAVIAIGAVSPAFPKRTAPLLIPVCTLPVQLGFYYTFPFYSVFLNMIVIAFAPFLIAGGMLSLLPCLMATAVSVSLPGPAAALFSVSRLISLIPGIILGLYDWLCLTSEKLPFHTIIAGKPAPWLVILYLLILAAATAAGYSGVKKRKKTVFQFFAVTAAVILLLTVRYRPPFSLYMWNVGQGDGLCILTHDEGGDSCILIDGGSSSRQGIGRNVEIPFLKYHGVSRIDCYVLTHDDMDHCNGLLELLDQHGEAGSIEVGAVALPSVKVDSKGVFYRQIEETATKKGIPLVYLSRGMVYDRGKLSLGCMHPEKEASYKDANAYSVVLLLRYGQFSAVLTGDLEGEGEQEMLADLGEGHISADILKVAHHGSSGGTSEAFLEKVSASAALISCGVDNPYGHPAPETLLRLRKAGMRIYDTRLMGQISVLTDGENSYLVHTFY